jgi:hypothetical protein
MSKNWTSIGGIIHCYEHPSDTCLIVRLQQVKEKSEFHDDVLATATEDINDILEKTAASRPDGKRLSFLRTGSGLMLAWTECSDPPVTLESDPAVVRATLGLS